MSLRMDWPALRSPASPGGLWEPPDRGAKARRGCSVPARGRRSAGLLEGAAAGYGAGAASAGGVAGRKEVGPVVFLDVDGVLHSVRCTRQSQQFGRAQMAQLVRTIEGSGASIVLSTAWRTIPEARMTVCAKLREAGLPQPIGKTPDFGMMRRPCEILTWVDQYRPAAWVSIDDMPLDADPRMRGHFVRTNPLQGLTPVLAAEAIRLLKSQMAEKQTPPASASSYASYT